MSESVAEIVERLLGACASEIEPLSGGITNANYKIVIDDEQLVLRIPGKDTELLGIDRTNEVAANRLAARIGVAPEVVAVDEESGCMVTRFLHGRVVPKEELATEPTLGEVITKLRDVHAAGRISATFDHFAVIRGYHELASTRGVDEPFDYPLASAVLDRIEAIRPFRPMVLGHNDLLNANLLHDGSVRILDWEYAGMADPFFDLANFSVNNELGSELDKVVVHHYFGRVNESFLAALVLMKLVSELREAMWGVAQLAISDLDFDFTQYAMERGGRFEVLLDGLDINELAMAAAAR